MPSAAHDRHPDAAQLEGHVRARGELTKRGLRCSEHLLVPSRVAADAERPTEVVAHHLHVREGASQPGELGDLRMVEPRVVGQVPAGQLGEAGAPGGVVHEAVDRVGAMVRDRRVAVPGGRMTDAHEPTAARLP
jgi:hypothetical protein